MIKIVGLEKGKVMDEKVIITDDGKITKFGAALIALDILADIGIYFLIHKIVKLCREK